MRLREHEGILPGRLDMHFCKPSEITVEDGYNVRDLATPEARAELDELKAQIKENGVVTPLKIRFDAVNEKIILVEGHRRRTAALELIAEYVESGGTAGRLIESVPIYPEPPGTDPVDRDFGLETSNSGTRLRPLELANLIHRLHTVRGLPLESIATRMGKSLASIKTTLAMRQMSEPVKQHVKNGEISATLANKISKNADPVQAEELIRANIEENKRLTGGKKSRVTPKTINRAKAKPKAEAQAQMPATPEPTKQDEPFAQLAPAAQEPQPDSISSASKPDDAADLTAQAAPGPAMAPPVAPVPVISGKANKILIDALEPFANLAHEHDFNERGDDEVVEVPIRHLKKAWVVFAAVTGGES